MNLETLVRKLGDYNYNIGRPIYFGEGGGDEMEYVKVHAHSVLKMGAADTIGSIRSNRGSDPGIAVAYGGFIGIDIAAASDAGGVLLLDINPDQKRFWRSVIELIKECPTAGDFNKHLSVLEYRFNIREMQPGGEEQYPSFTRNEAIYEKVRRWAQNGMMAATDMDALDSNRHKELAGLLKEGGHKVGTVFLSNVPYFYNTAEANPHMPRKVDFYSGRVEHTDYQRIFQNQRLIAGPEAQMVYADSWSPPSEFRLKQKKLREVLESVGVPAAQAR